MELGIGRGDSAQRVLGRTPVTVQHLERACVEIRELAAGREVDLDGTAVRLPWTSATSSRSGSRPTARRRCAARGASRTASSSSSPTPTSSSGRSVPGGGGDRGGPLARRHPGHVGGAGLRDRRPRPRPRPGPLVPRARLQPRRRPRPPLQVERPAPRADRLHRAPPRATTTRTTPGAGSDNAAFVTDEVVDRFCVIGTAEACEAKLARPRVPRRAASSTSTRWSTTPSPCCAASGPTSSLRFTPATASKGST